MNTITLANSPYGTANLRVRRIGIYGARGAGKTCFLACMKGNPADGGVHLTFPDDSGTDYLRAQWGRIKSGRLPDPNPVGRPEVLHLRLDAGELNWAMELQDYSGELVQPGAARKDEFTAALHDEAREWFMACDALLLFVDSSDPGDEQLDVLDKLLTELWRRGPDGRTVLRPVGLVLTKWDSRSAAAEPGGSGDEALAAYLARHEKIRHMQQKLQACVPALDEWRGPLFRVFAVSALGGSCRENRPPDVIRPYNLHEPLRWAAEQADWVCLEKARGRAEAWLDRLVPDYTAAIKEYVVLVSDCGIAQGPVREEIDKDRRELDGKRSQRWYGLALVAGALLVAAATACWFHVEAPYTELASFRKDNPAPKQAQSCVEADEAFLSSWYATFALWRRGTVNAWLADDRARAEEFEAEQALPAVQKTAATFAAQGAYRKVYDTYQKFLADFPHSGRRKEVEGLAQGARRLWDKQAWEALLSFQREQPESYQSIITRTREYLTIPGAEQREEAGKLIEQTEVRWDRADYARIRKGLQKPTDTQAIEATYPRAKEYLAAARPLKRMKEEVRAWKEWFEELQTPRDHFITVKSIEIPPGSALQAALGATEPRVAVAYGGQMHQTPWLRGERVAPETMLGPFRARWGRAGSLTIRTEGWGYFRNDRAEQTVEDARFPLIGVSGRFALTCRNNETVTVVLDCPSAVPPPLPEYPR